MTSKSILCLLRTVRRKSGLTQLEVARILGFSSEDPVSRHEHSTAVPSLLTALAYEALFRVPVSELFPGLYSAVETGIEERVANLERELHQSTATGRKAVPVARKLEFICERKSPQSN